MRRWVTIGLVVLVAGLLPPSATARRTRQIDPVRGPTRAAAWVAPVVGRTPAYARPQLSRVVAWLGARARITAMVVEPGGFRTDFSGRSLQQSADAIAEYADTAGRRRTEHDMTHGTQPGDPAKAARAIIDVVGPNAPPALLLLGEDAVTGFRRVLDAERAELEAWKHISLATAFESPARDV